MVRPRGPLGGRFGFRLFVTLNVNAGETVSAYTVAGRSGRHWLEADDAQRVTAFAVRHSQGGVSIVESRLNTERILVTWLSPNDWTNAGGFRYGNIAFELDWPDLVDGMRFYWDRLDAVSSSGVPHSHHR